jgi:DnaJ-class molecular chaperone
VSKFGARLIESAKQARSIARGECPYCHGECGHIDEDRFWVDCEECDGTGEVEDDEDDPDDADPWRT